MPQIKKARTTAGDTANMIARMRVAALLLALLAPVAAMAGADVYFFWRSGCPHCEREIQFLKKLEAEHAGLRVHYFNVWTGPEQRALITRVGETLRIDATAVPLTIVGDRVWSGYLDDASTGRQIRQRALECLEKICPDSVRGLLAGVKAGPAPANDASRHELPDALRLPVIGEVRLKNLSLPLLTVVIAALDGFNPCAMWVLVLLLGILVGEPDRRRRWLLGGAFLGASAAVYFLFLAAWLNLFLFLGFLMWAQFAIGVVALAGGVYYLRAYVLRRDEVCPVTAPQQRQRIFERMVDIIRRRNLWFALGGIVLLAAAVNLVELLCSAGLPAVYTRVLTLSQVPLWQYYGYLLLYITIFLLDDLVVFAMAMMTLEVAGLGMRFARQSRLIGGLLLVILGALLLLRPDWLRFA